MSWECKVVKIESVAKHPNADKLGIVEVEGTVCLVNLADTKEGDLRVLVPLESMVPLSNPVFKFLEKGNTGKEYARIKAVRLRGIFSDGILVPVPEVKWYQRKPKVGQNVADLLGAYKFEEGEDAPDRSKLNAVRRFFAKWVYFVLRYFGLYRAERHTKGPMPVFKFSNGRQKSTYELEKFAKCKAVLEGKEVVVTEKLHGCLEGSTYINMADGTRKCIKDISVGDVVLGTDVNGKVIPSKVTHKFNNGKTNKWLKIKVSTKTRGAPYFEIKCTPEHRFYNPETKEYVNAYDLKVNDPVVIYRKNPTLPYLQKQILTGMLLGDASLTWYENEERGWFVQFGHAETDAGYMDWIERGLGDWFIKSQPAVSGFGTNMLRGRSAISQLINENFGKFIKNGIKVVPKDIAAVLDPIALAFWYMDDGSLSHVAGQEDRASFATCGFSETDCKVLINALKSRYNIDATFSDHIDRGAKRNRIHLNSVNAEKFWLLVAPYLPSAMQRKLPERYRHGFGWMPTIGIEGFQSRMTDSIVCSIEDASARKSSTKWDIETETHNYFAKNVLVHNSNVSCFWDGGIPHAASRNLVKGPGDESVYSLVAKKYGLFDKMSKYPGLVLYGEVLGVQDLKYGHTSQDPGFVAFDLYDIKTGEFLNYDDFAAICKELDIPTAPVLYRGPFDEAKIGELVNSGNPKKPLMSVYDPKTLKEGVVVKPVQETRARFGRVALKWVSEHYLERKNGTEYH